MNINLANIDFIPGQGGGGVKPSGTLDISENGVYNVYSYSSASVDVHPSASLSETYISNGNYNITGEFNGGVITVDVPAPQFVTETLNVSENGVYNPSEGVDGYSQVVVDVPQSVTGYTEKDLTERNLNIVNLNNSASFVASEAFKNNTQIQTVYLPNCITVNNLAFASCYNLLSIYLPNCVSIGSSAFQSTGITSVDLLNCINIGSYAFQSCKSLQIVNLPIVSIISSNAFNNCTSLINVSLPECKLIMNAAFFSCSLLQNIDLPKCETLNEYAFNNCYQLSSVSLPNCTHIYGYVFSNCSSLTSVDLPKCEFLSDAFLRCSSLYSVSLPNCFHFGCRFEGTSVSYVELPMLGSVENHFYFNSVVKAISICRDYAGCPVFTYDVNWGNYLTSIYVPSELYYYFANSTEFSSFSSVLVSVPQSGSEPLISYSDGMIYGSARAINSTLLDVVGVSKGDVTVLSLPNCERIDDYYGYPFVGGALTEINLPECLKLGTYFSRCASLQRIYLPKLKEIRNEIFSSCTSLSEIDFPSAETINHYVFRGCTSLKVVKLSVCSNILSDAFYGGLQSDASVYLYSDKVCSINGYPFRNDTKIYVPASLVDAYKSAKYWSIWSNNIYPIE